MLFVAMGKPGHLLNLSLSGLLGLSGPIAKASWFIPSYVGTVATLNSVSTALPPPTVWPHTLCILPHFTAFCLIPSLHPPTSNYIRIYAISHASLKLVHISKITLKSSKLPIRSLVI